MDAILDILVAESDAIHGPMGICACHDESWLRGTMVHPLCMVGSDATALCLDGPLSGSTFLGAYTWAAWFFRHLARDWADLSTEEAVRRLTSLPAQRVGLAGRGRLAEGYFADLAIVDPERYGERGTLQEPNQLAEGVRHVVVNGRIALRDRVLTGQRAGHVLRRP